MYYHNFTCVLFYTYTSLVLANNKCLLYFMRFYICIFYGVLLYFILIYFLYKGGRQEEKQEEDGFHPQEIKQINL